MSSLRDIAEVAGLDARGVAGAHSARARRAADRPRAAHSSTPPSFAACHGSASWAWCRCLSGGDSHAASSIRWACYRLALLFLRQLSYDERFAAAVSPDDAELFIVAALLHDLGHWPFCHPIEDIHLPACRSTSCSPTAFCSKAKSPTRCATIGTSARATSWHCSRDKPRDTTPRHPVQHALGADRHRQDGLPGPRQPARRRALRPQLRSAPADRQPVL